MIRFTIHSTASPPQVLAALRAHAGEWRESQIPDDLRRTGIFAVDLQMRGDAATLRYFPRSADPFTKLRLELHATVKTDPSGGTLVEVRVGYEQLPYAGVAGVVLLAAVTAGLFAGTPLAVVGPAMFGGLLALNLLFIWQSNAARSRLSLGRLSAASRARWLAARDAV